MIKDIKEVEVIPVSLDREDYEKISEIAKLILGKNAWNSRSYMMSCAVKIFLNKVKNEGLFPVLTEYNQKGVI